MKKITLLVSLMLALSLGLVNASAATCSGVTFTHAPASLEVGQSFSLKITATNPSSPTDPWGDYSQAVLSLPPALTTSSGLTVDLTLANTPYSWTGVSASSAGTHMPTVNLTNSTGTCDLSDSVVVGAVEDPNIALSVSVDSTQLINVPYTLVATLTNNGDQNASDLFVSVSAAEGFLTVTSPTVPTTLSVGESQNLTFTLNSPKLTDDLVITITIQYKDASNTLQEFSTTSTKTVNVQGNDIPVGSDSQLLVGGPKAEQNLNFTADQSSTIDGQSEVGATIAITTTENVTNPEITVAKYASLDNGSLSGKTALGRYLVVSVPTSFNTKVQTATLKLFYQDSELSAANMNEGTLKAYKYNETSGSWDVLETTLDAAANTATVTLTGFSTFGLFGDANPAPAPPGGGGGGGGGGGLPACSYTFTEWSACSAGTQTRTGTKTTTSCSGTATKTETQPCTVTACTPNWQCTAFSACSSSGSQARTCTDVNSCGTSQGKPAESQVCQPPTSEVTTPEAGAATGLAVGQALFQYRASQGASTQFELEGVNHTLTVKQVKEASVVVIVQSEPVEFELEVGKEQAINIDEDPANDLVVRLNSLENGVALLTVGLPSSSGVSGTTVAILLIVVVAVGFFLHKRRQGSDKLKITIKRRE